ncbi:MAG TPA: GtrA family protein [Candidatus Paceibacterota bacterium]|jgi:dolichol-phosphate mannosyltransferase
MSFKGAIRRLSVGRPAHTGIEYLRFLPVSAVTSLIDFGVLILLTELASVHYLTSATIAFTAGQAWSYVVSVTWVFARMHARDHTHGFIMFLFLSCIGLVTTVFLLWVMTEHFGLYYLYSKIICSAITFQLLFVLRKKFLFS